MRRLSRPALSAPTQTYLEDVTKDIVEAADERAAADTKWVNKNRRHFDDVRAALRSMASGLVRCMYCEDSAGTDIEHYRPKATFPTFSFTWTNYLLACSHCNSNEKRNQFPVDEGGKPLLIDPSVDDSLEHLALVPHLGEFTSRTDQGRASIDVYGLNRPELVQGRVDAWVGLDQLIRGYADLRSRQMTRVAERVLDTILNAAFGSVREVMVQYALSGVPLLSDATRDALLAYPELRA